jgi:AraC family transcriptional regulator
MPVFLFQRVFAILANVSLTDYIRNRRLTKAALRASAHENPGDRHSGPVRFTSHRMHLRRRFRREMGVSPSQVRKEKGKENVQFVNYPPLRFKLTITGVT